MKNENLHKSVQSMQSYSSSKKAKLFGPPCTLFTFAFAFESKKDGKLYYNCNQCVAAKQKELVDGSSIKTIHLYNNIIVNGNPSHGHYPGCQLIRCAQVHAEKKKRQASQLVRSSLSSVANARLNLHAEMT